MSNSIDPDETAHYEPFHLDLRCLQKPIIIAYGSERVKGNGYTFRETTLSQFFCEKWSTLQGVFQTWGANSFLLR